MKARSINEILGELNENSTLNEIRRAKNEIWDNMKAYPLVQIEFCREYLDEMMTAAAAKVNRKKHRKW